MTDAAARSASSLSSTGSVTARSIGEYAFLT
jgi:hypothetical protein